MGLDVRGGGSESEGQKDGWKGVIIKRGEKREIKERGGNKEETAAVRM